MRRKRLTVILSLILILAALTPTVYAYMFRQSQTVKNVFVPAQVDCEVTETFTGSSKSNIKVTNTSNIEAYVRVILVCNWQDSKGNPVVRDADPPSISLGTDWVVHDGIYYYTKPLDPKEETATALSTTAITRPAPIKETVNQNGVITEYWYYPVIEVIAEAIQSLPEDEVEKVWGVTITDGIIQ